MVSDKEFDSDPVYNKRSLKTKTKSHDDEVTDFYNRETLKVDSNHTCLVVFRGNQLELYFKERRELLLSDSYSSDE